MTLVRWSPLGLTSSRTRDDVDRLLDTFFTTGPARFAPAVDVHETADAFVVRLDLPGISPQDVQVRLEGDTLSIRGERKSEHQESQGPLLRSERFTGRFERSFTLAARVQSDRVTATSKDGVLEIRVPKAEEAKVREIPVQSA